MTPPLLLVAGSDGHRRRSFLRNLCKTKIQAGVTVRTVTGSSAATEFDSILNTAGILFEGDTLVVFEDPESKTLLPTLTAFVKEPNPAVVGVIVSEDDNPKGKLYDLVPESGRKLFPLPASYKLDEFAASYLVTETTRRGFKVDQKLATAIVRKVGNDIGFLTFEIDKAVRLATTRGSRDLDVTVFRDSLTSVTETDGSSIVEAIGTRNLKRMVDELAAYYDSRKGDPTVEFCGRVLAPTVTRWLAAASLHERGFSPSTAAARMESNPWYWEHKVLPYAKQWGVKGVARLVKVIAESQESVFDGSLKPWDFMVLSLIRAF